MRKKDRKKTEFACELGFYQWKTKILRLVQNHGDLSKTDDVVIATPTLTDHIDRLDEVFDYIKRADLKFKPTKCEILRDSLKYL